MDLKKIAKAPSVLVILGGLAFLRFMLGLTWMRHGIHMVILKILKLQL